MLAKSDIISKLQKEILSLQGYKPVLETRIDHSGMGMINEAFPNKEFPLGAIHEFCCSGEEEFAATAGFVSGLVSCIIRNGTAIWISQSKSVFPPALAYFGLKPEHFVFVQMQKERDLLWAMEEALKCTGLKAVICECQNLSFMASRRFQLAVEASGVTGFVIRKNYRVFNTTASLTRWEVKPIPSMIKDDLPGVGAPHWQANLLRVRNAKPRFWKLEWSHGKFIEIEQSAPAISLHHKKTG
jgi:protein ImuA